MMSETRSKDIGSRLRHLAQMDREEDETTDEDEEALLNRVLEMSRQQNSMDEERRRMAGIPPLSDTSETTTSTPEWAGAVGVEEELAKWLEEPFASRAQKVIDSSTLEMYAQIPVEEQIDLMTKLSLVPTGASKAEEQASTPTDHPKLVDDAMLKRAIELSKDPMEQHNAEMKDLMRALNSSRQYRNSNSNNTHGIPDLPIVDVEEEDEEGEVMDAAAAADDDDDDDAQDREYLNNQIAQAIAESTKSFTQEALLRELEEEETVAQISRQKGARKPVCIDGNNVAYSHGNHQKFSPKGILLVYNYFLQRGHEDIHAFYTPNSRLSINDRQWLSKMENAGFLKPVRSKHYDDYTILQTAKVSGGVVVSNDKFRDISRTHPDLAVIINTSVLPFQFVGDMFIPQEDPLGRNGPILNEFLKF